MKKLQIFTILLVLFALNTNHAQEDPEVNVQSLLTTAPVNSVYAFTSSDNTIVGSAYIQETFMPAKLSLNDSNKIYNLKYNAYSDEIEIQNEGQKSGALNKNIANLLIVFIADNKTYQALNYINENGNTTKGYFVHVNSANSNHKLLIKETVIFLEKKPSESGYDKAKPAKLKRIKDQYFIAIGSNAAIEFPKKKKDFSKVFPVNYDVILKYMKKNKLKTSKEEDLIQLTNYINTL